MYQPPEGQQLYYSSSLSQKLVPQRKPKHRPWPWIVALVAMLFVGYSVGYSIGRLNPTESKILMSSLPPEQWTTVQTFSGASGENTPAFQVSGMWRIQWTCSPPQPSEYYHISISVYDVNGSLADAGAVSANCAAGNFNGVSEEHEGGNMYLKISANGPYTITVQDLE